MDIDVANPYQAPGAPVLVAAPAERSARLYAPATWKFLLLSLCTFNLYSIVWFYRNWVIVRRVQQARLSPVASALFCGITAYFCFERMEDVLFKRLGRRDAPALNGAGAALMFFVLNALSRLPEPFWLLSLASPLPVLWVNRKVRAANVACREQVGEDDRMAWWVWVLCFFGLCCFALAMLGLTLPDTDG